MTNKISFTKAILILIFPLFFLVSCSKPYEKYIGYWKLDGSKYNEIAEISKNGDVYLFNKNIINESSKPIAMEESKDELAINNGFLLINFKLADDSTMLIEDKKYIRISQDEVSKIKDEVKQKADNRRACQDLKNEYYKELKKYNSFYNEKDKAKRNEIKTKYTELVKTIPNCKL